MSVRTILLTGSTGFIGSHVLEALVKSGAAVCVVTHSTSPTNRIKEFLHSPNVKVYHNTIVEMRRAFTEQKIDCVVHLATKYIKQHTTAEEVEEMIEGNVVYPAIILDLMREFRVRSIVTAGTFFEYDLSQSVTLTEESPVTPYNVYARTKLMFDSVVQDYTRWYRLSSVHLRLFAPYGPRDNEKVIPFVIQSLLAKRPLQLTPGEQQWNFTYVGDIAEAFAKAVSYALAMPAGHEIFNIGHPDATAIKTVVSSIEKQLEVSSLVSYNKPYPPQEIFFVSCDGKKAYEKLGWQVHTSIAEGLQKTIQYYQSLK